VDKFGLRGSTGISRISKFWREGITDVAMVEFILVAKGDRSGPGQRGIGGLKVSSGDEEHPGQSQRYIDL